MKYIGIITYFYYYNYGTMLQGYATRRAFEKCGAGDVSSHIIDCRFGEKKFTKWDIVEIRIKRFFVYFTEMKRIYKTLAYQKQSVLKQDVFARFAKQMCGLTDNTYIHSDDLYDNPPIYDIYVTGSDQTWSPKVGLRDSLFLGFAPKGKTRAAYAPSIGVTTYSNEQSNFVKERLAKYQFVSCREKYGSEILQALSPVKVETVLDPTLMLSADEWREISINPQRKGKYILCYFIGDRMYYRRFARRLSELTGLPLVFIPISYVDFTKGDNMEWKAGPREFLGLIDNAEYVLTDSFHGTIFSINFNKTFFSFVKHKGLDAMDNMRIVDILERLALKDRLLDDYMDGDIDASHINYTKTNELLAMERQVSEAYIHKIIDSI